MKKKGLVLAILLLQAGLMFAQSEATLSAVVTGAARQFGNSIPSFSQILVLHIKSPTEALQGYLVSQLTNELAKNPLFKVVREGNRPNLGAYNLKLDQEIGNDQAVTIANAAGVHAVVIGAVTGSGNSYTLTLRSVSSKGKVTPTQTFRLRSDNTLADLLKAAPAVQPAPAPVVQPVPAPVQPAPAPVVVQPTPAPAPAAPPASKRADPDTANWDIAKLDTAKNAAYLSDVEKDVILEMNKVRSNPKKYAELYIRPALQNYRGTEKSAANELFAELSKSNGVVLLIPEPGLSRAAKDHTNDQGKTGKTGHDGNDRSDPFGRMNRYGKWAGAAGENISYGMSAARDIIIQLLVDDGVPDRGHRKNIMNKAFTRTGVSVGTHPRYRAMCVLDYAGGYTNK